MVTLSVACASLAADPCVFLVTTKSGQDIALSDVVICWSTTPEDMVRISEDYAENEEKKIDESICPGHSSMGISCETFQSPSNASLTLKERPSGSTYVVFTLEHKMGESAVGIKMDMIENGDNFLSGNSPEGRQSIALDQVVSISTKKPQHTHK
jgi:hypothetical protein